MSNEPVAWILKTGHGTKIVEKKPYCEVDLWKPLFNHPSQEWISVKDRLPDDGQTVAFVVKDRSDSYLNGMVLGGKYIGGAMPCFSVPGMGCSASHWQPLPKAPKEQV